MAHPVTYIACAEDGDGSLSAPTRTDESLARADMDTLSRRPGVLVAQLWARRGDVRVQLASKYTYERSPAFVVAG